MSTELVTTENQTNAFATMENVQAGFETMQGFELVQRVAKMFSSSTLVPKEYQGNIANCVIALNMANRMQADPLLVMQNLYMVHGKPGWSSQFLIATFNTCGRFTALRYGWQGEVGTDEYGCFAEALEKSTGELLTGSLITIGMAKEEGWYAKNGSKWKTMPQQMLMYRASSFFIRAYSPELAMGFRTADELEEMEVEEFPKPYITNMPSRIEKLEKEQKEIHRDAVDA